MHQNAYDFTVTTHGKWILTGEHAVIRGYPAIIFPVPSRALSLTYYNTQRHPEAVFASECNDVLKCVFWAALKHAMALINQPYDAIKGQFVITNNIPISMGMGASAALCVAIGRWLIWRGWLLENRLFEFARELESLFHNESSGADIAACMANAGIRFVRTGEINQITLNWQPIWYLSHSSATSETAYCVKQVKKLYQQDPDFGQQLDNDMHTSVKLAETALKQQNADKGLTILKQAIDTGYTCFKRWGLIEGKLVEHINALKAAGALAIKPTGSGGGGYVLSLWEKPPVNMPFELIQL